MVDVALLIIRANYWIAMGRIPLQHDATVTRPDLVIDAMLLSLEGPEVELGRLGPNCM